jgi:hypothetical protein
MIKIILLRGFFLTLGLQNQRSSFMASESKSESSSTSTSLSIEESKKRKKASDFFDKMLTLPKEELAGYFNSKPYEERKALLTTKLYKGVDSSYLLRFVKNCSKDLFDNFFKGLPGYFKSCTDDELGQLLQCAIIVDSKSKVHECADKVDWLLTQFLYNNNSKTGIERANKVIKEYLSFDKLSPYFSKLPIKFTIAAINIVAEKIKSNKSSLLEVAATFALGRSHPQEVEIIPAAEESKPKKTKLTNLPSEDYAETLTTQPQSLPLTQLNPALVPVVSYMAHQQAHQQALLAYQQAYQRAYPHYACIFARLYAEQNLTLIQHNSSSDGQATIAEQGEENLSGMHHRPGSS